jgi:predicted nucleic acid-binding protein
MYLLDTNILSELIKKRPNQHLLLKLQSKPSQSLYIYKSILVTANTRHYSRIKDLKIENWIG